MIPIQLMEAAGLTRTTDTLSDTTSFMQALADPNVMQQVLQATQKLNENKFYRFFDNYNTEIGEVMEEVVSIRFNDILPKKIPVIGKRGLPLKRTKKSEIYDQYNKDNNKKPSNYDWLLQKLDKSIKSAEVKAIRAVRKKEKSEKKLNEIPSPLVERALSFADAKLCGNISFQQTKAEFFDYLIGIVIYTDQVDFYLVPSEDILSGKLKISKQHAGAIDDDGTTSEGHLSVRHLESYKIKTVYNEDELLAADNLEAYIASIFNDSNI